jgi:sarcosine oxidase
MRTISSPYVVLGAGAMGSATAYHLARRGQSVVLVEQFALGHTRGSSHGAARITRHSYADPQYARLMPDAFRAWKVLEADAGQNIFLRTGCITLCAGGVDHVARITANLQDMGITHRRMSGREWRQAAPVWTVADTDDAVFEPDAGLVAAARAVKLEVELARRLGGDRVQVLERTPVRRIDLDAASPTLVTDTHKIVAEHLIVTAGSWTSRLVPRFPVPLRPTRQQVVYFRPRDPLPFSPGRFPVFIYFPSPDPDEAMYGMPMYEGMGVKVALNGGPDVDPDHVEQTVGDDYRERMRQFVRKHIPALAEAPIDFSEVCLYTVAPKHQFRIGFLSGKPNVLVASPCSGHGFKFSCLIGSVLADLTTSGHTAIDIAPWMMS